MSTKDNGGSAFPITAEQHPNGISSEMGMTLLDYFMAHAPAEPQPWFKPVMLTAKPTPPQQPAYPWTSAESREFEGYGDWLGLSDLVEPRIRDYFTAAEAHQQADAAWTKEFSKQRYVQWPRAWAEHMLEERAK